jgi:hypothetical protein
LEKEKKGKKYLNEPSSDTKILRIYIVPNGHADSYHAVLRFHGNVGQEKGQEGVLDGRFGLGDFFQ